MPLADVHHSLVCWVLECWWWWFDWILMEFYFLSDVFVWRVSVCPSHTLGLTREQRGA